MIVRTTKNGSNYEQGIGIGSEMTTTEQFNKARNYNKEEIKLKKYNKV